jgi:hypothetical protein
MASWKTHSVRATSANNIASWWATAITGRGRAEIAGFALLAEVRAPELGAISIDRMDAHERAYYARSFDEGLS